MTPHPRPFVLVGRLSPNLLFYSLAFYLALSPHLLYPFMSILFYIYLSFSIYPFLHLLYPSLSILFSIYSITLYRSIIFPTHCISLLTSSCSHLRQTVFEFSLSTLLSLFTLFLLYPYPSTCLFLLSVLYSLLFHLLTYPCPSLYLIYCSYRYLLTFLRFYRCCAIPIYYPICVSTYSLSVVLPLSIPASLSIPRLTH